MTRRLRIALFTAGFLLAVALMRVPSDPMGMQTAHAQTGSQTDTGNSSPSTTPGTPGTLQGAIVSSRLQPLFLDPVVALLPSPKYVFDRTLYLLTARQLFRSTDGGENWAVLSNRPEHDEQAGRYVQGSIVDVGNNRHLLLLATSRGELFTLDPQMGDWEPHARRFDSASVMQGDFSTEKALRILHRDGAIRTDVDGQVIARTREGADSFETRVAQIEHLSEGDRPRMLVTTATYPVRPFGNPCPPCRVTLNAAQFVQGAYGWHVAVEPGGFELVLQVADQAPTGELLSLGNGVNGLLFEDTWRVDGNTRTTATLLAPVDERFAAVFQATLHEDNSDAMDCGLDASTCFSYTATLFLGDERQTGYPHIHLTVAGTRLEDGAVLPVNEDNVYSFDGEQYVLSETAEPTGELTMDIEYRDDFYVETFGYTRDAPNIAHYVLVVPAADAHLFDGVSVFTSIQFPATPDDPIRLVESQQEYAWILDYLHKAPQGRFRGRFPAGDYLVKAAFLAAPVSREEAGLGDDAILWSGVTGGGASTREYIEVTVEAGQTKTLDILMTDANGWACPWLYVHDGEGYVRVTELLRNLEGADAQRVEETRLGPVPVVDGTVRLRLAEEKPEISYIDQLAVMINGVRVQPGGALGDRLFAVDGDMLTLREGQTVELVFPVPLRFDQAEFVHVTVVAQGYYVRTP